MFNITEIRHGHKRFEHANERMVDRIAGRAAAFAKRHQVERAEFRHRRGSVKRGARAKIIRLKSGRRIRITNVARTKSGKPLALFLEGGTKAHVIRARRGRALSFFWLRVSKKMVVRQVNHPGTKAYRFIRASADAASQQARVELLRSMRTLAKQF